MRGRGRANHSLVSSNIANSSHPISHLSLIPVSHLISSHWCCLSIEKRQHANSGWLKREQAICD